MVVAAGPGRTRCLSATAARDRRAQAMGRTRPTVRTLTQTDACVTYDVTRDRPGLGRTHRAGPGPPGRYSQLLQPRAHRPRQVDAGRPDAAAHRCGREPQHARS